LKRDNFARVPKRPNPRPTSGLNRDHSGMAEGNAS
jgi:hypothetical protein